MAIPFLSVDFGKIEGGELKVLISWPRELTKEQLLNKKIILPVSWMDRYSFWMSGLVKNWYISSATTLCSRGGSSTTVIIVLQHTRQVLLSIQTWRTSESLLVCSYASVDTISP